MGSQAAPNGLSANSIKINEHTKLGGKGVRGTEEEGVGRAWEASDQNTAHIGLERWHMLRAYVAPQRTQGLLPAPTWCRLTLLPQSASRKE